tara:strand:+ start:1721 stop:1972 length:252 start_codon:yes stop_codon:yes gene_type:complete
MPIYGWAGPGKLRPMTFESTKTPEVSEPIAPSKDDSKVVIFECTVCDKRFKKAMIAARHFNSAHSEMKVDKDSWRGYVKETSE